MLAMPVTPCQPYRLLVGYFWLAMLSYLVASHSYWLLFCWSCWLATPCWPCQLLPCRPLLYFCQPCWLLPTSCPCQPCWILPQILSCWPCQLLPAGHAGYSLPAMPAVTFSQLASSAMLVTPCQPCRLLFAGHAGYSLPAMLVTPCQLSAGTPYG